MISANIVSRLDLLPVSKTVVQTTTGQSETEVYRLRVTPIQSGPLGIGKIVPFPRGCDVDALGMPLLAHDYDVLLGMDVISQFHLTVYQQECIIRDRPPTDSSGLSDS